jgi:hypothetical protein
MNNSIPSKDDNYTPAEPAQYAGTAKRHLEEGAGRLSGQSQPQGEPDGLIFHWEAPSLSNPALFTFIAEVHRQRDKSKVRFQIDTAKLETAGRTADLEKLRDILVARHAGIDDRRSLLRSIEWMLTISLEQTSPELTPDERQLKVRQLLLA